MAESERKPIRVLLVDGSAVALTLLRRALSSKEDLLIEGVRSAAQALDLIPDLDPHVICTGLQLPDMDGVAFSQAVMERFPRPVLVISSSIHEESFGNVFRMLEAGALDILLKPPAWHAQEVEKFSLQLQKRIRLLARLSTIPDFSKDVSSTPIPLDALSTVNMVILGAGLGGPQAIREILNTLPVDFPAPILCIQHMEPALQPAFLHWLGQQTPMPVQLATHGESPMAGSVYLSPVGHHLLVDSQGRLVTSSNTTLSSEFPSITLTMESAASHMGSAVVAVLLSGTGEDGARGLEAVARSGGTTVALDEPSAMAFDLPARLLELGAVRYVLPCGVMAQALLNLTGKTEIDRESYQEIVPSACLSNDGILIVEDSPTQAFKLRRFLQESGFQVAVAKDGLEGLEGVRTQRPKLVISDISMPNMDGFELCRTLKKDPLFSNIPVILLTALTGPEEILEGLAAGADNYLTKPWDGPYLLKRIQNVLDDKSRGSEAEEKLSMTFEGREYHITASRRQVLDLLLSTYQKAVIQNKSLIDQQLELKMLNVRLVDQSTRQDMLNLRLKNEIAQRQEIEKTQGRTLRELEEANRELNDFAYIISHDLKAPFRAVGSLTNWLISDYASELSEEGRELLHLLHGRADRLNGLIDALLNYTRVSRVNESLQPLNLDSLILDIVKGIKQPEEMEILLDSPLPTILFDSKRAEQIFSVLIHNAVQFMDKPVGVIRVGLESETSEWWQFRVSDNGPGIEEKYFEKIFGIFQTLQARDELETAGMGLALARKIVGKFGGRIWLTSKINKGCDFFFTLPKQPDRVLSIQGRSKDRFSAHYSAAKVGIL